ncbi:hypothetical protein BGW39_001954 [Mortierella sp. 14UC]|nr:hypothetical protein BGW39_001954 [Mortierella sp. 14UC]
MTPSFSTDAAFTFEATDQFGDFLLDPGEPPIEQDDTYSDDNSGSYYCTYNGHSDHDELELQSDYDSYDDYDGFCLAPPSPRKPKSKSKRNNMLRKKPTPKKQSVETKIAQPLLDSPNPPGLAPEILEHICTHLSQSTLLYSVNRVCRKWNEVSNRLIRRAGTWKPVKDAQEQLLQQWSKINTLELWCHRDPECPIRYISSTTRAFFWNALIAAITETKPTEQGAQKDGTDTANNNHNNSYNKADLAAASSLLCTIRHLRLQDLTMSYYYAMQKLYGHFQFIESLTITTANHYMNLPLFAILTDFPALKVLNLPLEHCLNSELTHGDDDDKIDDTPEPEVDPETASLFPRQPCVIPPPKMFPDRYRLQEFDVGGLCTHLRVLERLFVTCPDLRVFKANNLDVNMHIRQQGEDAEHNARQRLIDLAAKHCPKLEWYNFCRLGPLATDGDHLASIARAFPQHRMLSMTFGGHQYEMSTILAARDLLSRITLLEICPPGSARAQSMRTNRILCLTPNLLHLVAPKLYFHTGCFWQPPTPAEPKPKPIFHTIRDRKRHERNERRKARQQALARYQPRPAAAISASPTLTTTISNDNTNDGSETDEDDNNEQEEEQVEGSPTPIDPSIPVTWQLYNLKTADMSLHGQSDMVPFTRYISRHKLFRNLVSFKFTVPELRVAQRKTFANLKKPAAATITTTPTAVYTSVSSFLPPPLPEPARFPNELLALYGLRCLEECVLRTTAVPGMLLASDFEFLSRKADFQTMFFLPETDNTKKEEREAEKDEGQWKNETFWPKLATFHVYYSEISPLVNTSKLVAGIERIRPGVSVRFQFRADQ